MQRIKFGKIVAFVLLTLAVSVICRSGDVSAQSLDVASVHKPPLSTPEGTGMIDLIVKEAFSRIGVTIQIIVADSTNALEKTDKGLYDADLMRIGGANEKYPNIVQVPETYFDYEFVAFSKTVNETMTGYEGLKPYRLVVPAGWVETNKNVTEANTKSVVRIASPFEMFNMLVKGETDLVIYNRLVGYELIKETGLSDIHALEPPLAVRPMFLYLNKKHNDLVAKLASAISDMKKDGTIRKIIDETLSKYKKQ